MVPISIRTALFPVGGLGSRFLPATKAVPKEMLPLLNKPLIQYAVEEALASGIERLIFVTGKGKDAIENHFDRAFEAEYILKKRGKLQALEQLSIKGLSPGSIVYIRQTEPLGLGHAIWCARHVINEPFAVLLADDLILGNKPELSYLIEAFDQQEGHWVSTQEVSATDVEKYGIIKGQKLSNGVMKAESLVEKPQASQAPSRTAILGRYVLTPAIFSHLDQQVRQNHTIEKEIQLTDALSSMISQAPFHGLPLKGKRFDCGTMEGMFEAILYAAQDIPALQPFLKKAVA